MRSSLRFQNLALRFEPYIEELHVLFAGANVAYGFPERLLPFARQVSADGPVHDGVRAIVREVISREPREIPHGELVELILVAAGGTEIDEEGSDAQQTERVLSRLVGEVMTSPELPPADTGNAPASGNAAAMSAQAVRWASPPRFIGLAGLCAFLLPLGINWMTSRRASQPPPTARAHVHPRPPVPFTVPMPSSEPWSLSISDPPVPVSRRGSASSGPRNSSVASPEGQSPAARAGHSGTQKADLPGTAVAPRSPAPFSSSAEAAPRQTDMPGSDRGSSLPAAEVTPAPGAPPAQAPQPSPGQPPV